MAQEMQRRQAPVHSIEAQVLSQPVFVLVFPLEQTCDRLTGGHPEEKRETDCVEFLDVFDVLLGEELLGRVRRTTPPWAGDEGHLFC